MAAVFNRTEAVNLLLRHGADPGLQDAWSLTAHAVAVVVNAPDTPAQPTQGFSRLQPDAASKRSVVIERSHGRPS